jgi:hypothetical protein
MSWSDLVSNLNSKGIPFPVIRDPNTGKGSVTATAFIVSSALCAGCAFLAAVSALAKLAGVFANFAEAQQAITNAFGLSFQFFLACGGFYLGRRIGRDSKGNVTVDPKQDDNSP